MIGGRHHDDGRQAQVTGRILVQPLQELEAIDARHFQIQQNDVGQRMRDTVAVFVFAQQIIDGLLAVIDHLDPALVRALESLPHEQFIVLVVIHQQKCSFHSSRVAVSTSHLPATSQ